MSKSWVFLFGPAHRHPVTGEPLANRYVRIEEPDEPAARRMMFAMFGARWSHCVPGTRAGYYEEVYGDTELPRSEWPPLPEPDAQADTPALEPPTSAPGDSP